MKRGNQKVSLISLFVCSPEPPPFTLRLFLTAHMSSGKFGSTNGKDKRAEKERRVSDRRDQTRSPEKGVLSTRLGERRKQTRRIKDRKAEG